MAAQTSSITLPETTPEANAAQLAIRRIAVIALLSILLGFAMQGLILAAKLVAGHGFSGAQFLVDLAQGVTWAFFVCTGVGIGTAIVKARAALVGVLGLICAPLAVALAKSSQKAMAGLLDAAAQPAAMSLATISTLRAVEYGLLGWLLGTLARREVSRPAPYLGSGAAIGIVFGGAIATLGYQLALANGLSPALPQVLGSAINEVVFPIGCAFVIYMGQVVGRNLRVISDGAGA